MLDEVDEVAWAKSSHAYGKAKDVPDLLRALLAREVKARDKAISQLAASICHQGTLYSATAKAVPFLVALASSPKVKNREKILGLLADIATLGDHEQFLLAGAPRSLGRVPATFKRAVKAVHDGADAYAALLMDTAALVRSWAAFVLAWIPAAAKATLPPVRAALAREKDEVTKASLMLTLAYLDPAAGFDAALGAKTTAIRVAAALATAHVKRGAIDDKTREILGAAGAKKKLVAAGLPWLGGDLASFAVQVIAALPRTEETDGYLVAAMEARGHASSFAANVLVRRLFPLRSAEKRASAMQTKQGRRDKKDDALLAAITVQRDKLTPLQHRALTALGAEVGFDNALVEALDQGGLPSTAPLMKRWLEGAPAPALSMLDREVAFAGKARSLGDLVIAAADGEGGVHEAPLAAIQAALSAEEQVTLARKALEDINVCWGSAVSYELLWRASAKARKAAVAIKPMANEGDTYAVAVGVALAAIAIADGKPADPSVDKLLQQAYGFEPRVRDALAALPIDRREKWLLSRKRDDQRQPAEGFEGAWPYWHAAPTTKIADRALAHVATWTKADEWGGKRERYADPQLEALIAAFRAAGNDKDANRLAAALTKLRGR